VDNARVAQSRTRCDPARKVFRGKEAEIARLIEAGGSSTPQAVSFSENEITDDRLRMMFVCCHPVIPPEAQSRWR